MQKINTKKYAWIISIISVLIFLHFTKILIPFESLVISALRPVMGGFYSVSSSLRLTYNKQADKRDLSLLIKELESRANKLTAENAKLKTLEDENEILRQYLKFFAEDKRNYVMAKIISRGSLGDQLVGSSAVVINKGAKDGLLPGLAVVSGEGIIIGKIIKVKDHLAEVNITTNPSCKLAAAIQNNSKTSGIVQGELGLTARMEFIPQTDEIKVGDTVTTSGLEENIPRGLVVGRVSQVIKESNELWQSAVIEPLVDFDELVIVSVLLP